MGPPAAARRTAARVPGSRSRTARDHSLGWALDLQSLDRWTRPAPGSRPAAGRSRLWGLFRHAEGPQSSSPAGGISSGNQARDTTPGRLTEAKKAGIARRAETRGTGVPSRSGGTVTELTAMTAAPMHVRGMHGGESACRPGSVPRLRGATVIHLGLPLPTASCGLPASIGRAALERSRRSRGLSRGPS